MVYIVIKDRNRIYYYSEDNGKTCSSVSATAVQRHKLEAIWKLIQLAIAFIDTVVIARSFLFWENNNNCNNLLLLFFVKVQMYFLALALKQPYIIGIIIAVVVIL